MTKSTELTPKQLPGSLNNNNNEIELEEAMIIAHLHPLEAANHDELSEYRQDINTMHILSNRMLGKGGFGIVYKGAFENKERCAIKIVCNHTDDDRRRVNRELEILKFLLDKPSANIVKFYGTTTTLHPETQQNYCWISLEYMNFGSLDHLMKKKKDYKKITMDTKVTWMQQMMNGINFLHSHDVLHNDIKAANILLSKDEYGNICAKITDFGISTFDKNKIVEQSNQEGSRRNAGTLDWQAPEAIYGNHSKPADIYSSGMTLWQIVAGRRKPHENFWACAKMDELKWLDTGSTQYKKEKVMLMFDRVQSGKRKEIPKKCPPMVKNLISTMWDTAPEKRPTADKVVEILSSYKGSK